MPTWEWKKKPEDKVRNEQPEVTRKVRFEDRLREDVKLAGELGYADGLQGSAPGAAAATVEELAARGWAGAIGELHRDRARSETVLEHRRAEHKTASEAQKSIADELKTKEDERTGNPSPFNRVVGWMLIAFAALLFVSDMPLSLGLVADGLRIPAEAYQIENMRGDSPWRHEPYARRSPIAVPAQVWTEWVKAGRTVSATDFLRLPWTSVKLFWEVYALALGIALLGFVFKPLLDAMLGEKTNTRLRALVIITTVLFVTTIGVLGYFRGKVMRDQIVATLRAEAATIESQLAVANAGERTHLEDERTALTTRILEEEGNLLPTAALFFLTLTLPLIGAICFYFGTQRVEAAGILKRLEARSAKARSSTEQALQELADASAEFQHLTEVLGRHNAADADQEHVHSCLAAYKREHARGLTEKDRELTKMRAFDRLRLGFHEAISRKQRLRRTGSGMEAAS